MLRPFVCLIFLCLSIVGSSCTHRGDDSVANSLTIDMSYKNTQWYQELAAAKGMTDQRMLFDQFISDINEMARQAPIQLYQLDKSGQSTPIKSLNSASTQVSEKIFARPYNNSPYSYTSSVQLKDTTFHVTTTVFHQNDAKNPVDSHSIMIPLLSSREKNAEIISVSRQLLKEFENKMITNELAYAQRQKLDVPTEKIASGVSFCLLGTAAHANLVALERRARLISRDQSLVMAGTAMMAFSLYAVSFDAENSDREDAVLESRNTALKTLPTL